MAKSARASVLKKNNQRLKKKVFGPVEQARAERLNKKLLELAQAPKPSDDAKMDVEAVAGEAAEVSGETRSNTALKKAREAKKNRVEKKRVRKERNKITFTRAKGKPGRR